MSGESVLREIRDKLGGLPLEGWAQIDDAQPDQWQERLLQQQIDQATRYRLTFTSEAGRWVLEDLIREFYMARIVDPQATQFEAGIRQGQADAVRRILFMIDFANTGAGQPATPTKE